jgi:hypothetical protein
MQRERKFSIRNSRSEYLRSIYLKWCLNQVPSRYAELLQSAYLHFAGTTGPYQAQGIEYRIRNGI